MKNRELAAMFDEIADFLEIRDERYKARSYRTAARNIESLPEAIEAVHERGELTEIPGVGESIAERIAEYLETGDLAYYEALKAELPIDIEAITSVQGVGPKTAKRLYRSLGVATLEDLERAAAEGRIAEVEGFGEKSQSNILNHLERAKRGRERMLLGRAFPIAKAVETRLAESSAFDRVAIVGSFRRRRPTVGDIDILATAHSTGAAVDRFCTHEDVTEVLARGDTKSSVLVTGDLQMDLRLVEPGEYGAALVYFTGSKAHNIALRQRAIDRGWKLNEYGLFEESGGTDPGVRRRGGDLVAGETEPAVYAALDLEWIPPELREATGELEAAAAGDLPDLIEPADVRGDLQVHTTYSDGSHSVREMAEAADDRGLEYLLISDHGPGGPTPSTLDATAFDRQRGDIDEVNADRAVGVTLLHGLEADITEDGLAVPSDWSDRCDLVVAGLHGRPDAPTQVVLEAFDRSPIDVFAHPSNRLINEREPLELDMDAIAARAAEAGIAIEINAQPERLDLDWRSVKRYRDTVDYVVSTDAHTVGGLDYLHLGVSQARRGWCEAGDVLNTCPLEDLRERFDW